MHSTSNRSGTMPDVPSALPKAEAARLRGDVPDASSEELRERSAMEKITALRERFDDEASLEDRLWSALERSVSMLERRLGTESADVYATAVRNIAETLDRLGMLKPPPVEAPEPNVDEVWVAARETGLSTVTADAIVSHLRDRYEGRARTRQDVWDGVAEGERA